MNVNPAAGKKKKPLAEKQLSSNKQDAGAKQNPKPKSDPAKKPLTAVKKPGSRAKPLTPKQKKVKKIQMRVAKINDLRMKMKNGDQETQKEIEKVVEMLTKKKEKSNHQKRKLSMYKNMLSGKFVIKEVKKGKENKRTSGKPKAKPAAATPNAKPPINKGKQEKTKKGKPQPQK